MEADGQEDKAKSGRQWVGPPYRTPPEGDDDQRRNAERCGGEHQIGEAV
ncbi:MAG TPA: hypothetical protein VGR82_08855 [Methylomirabilota bacterium]|nr:hypothetical protein [Methylomirabilota bacterium]